jgi:dTMP kinase
MIGDYLKSRGISVLSTKEPTDKPPIGSLIREVLKKEISLDPLSLQLLFFAERQEHLKNEIMPALESGKWVVCDRYFYSTIAYGAMDISFDWLAKMSDWMFLKPDMTFFIDVRPEICLERIKGDTARNGNTEFFEKLDKLKKVEANYKKVFQLFTVLDINGEESPGDIFEEIKFRLLGVF